MSATTAAAAPVTPKRSAAPKRVPLPKPAASTRRQSADKIDKAKKALLAGNLKKVQSTNMRDITFRDHRSKIMTPVANYMSEDAYALQQSQYVLE